MHSKENTQATTFKSLALSNGSIARFSASIIAGGIVTFGLFSVMHALIDQRNDRPLISEPVILVSSILDIPEEKTKVIESQLKNTFDRAAKQALRKWRYQPKMVGGSAVSIDGLQIQLDFSLASN